MEAFSRKEQFKVCKGDNLEIMHIDMVAAKKLLGN